MSVCCECCVLSGRSLRDELITRPEEPYRLCACACVCVIYKPPYGEDHGPLWIAGPKAKKKYFLQKLRQKYAAATPLDVSCLAV